MMDAIEKRARELLAASCPILKDEYFDNSPHMTAINLHESLLAVIAALTPPEGFVLVPVEPTEQMRDAGNEAEDEGKFPSEVYAVMLAARPEVPNVND